MLNVLNYKLKIKICPTIYVVTGYTSNLYLSQYILQMINNTYAYLYCISEEKINKFGRGLHLIDLADTSETTSIQGLHFISLCFFFKN